MLYTHARMILTTIALGLAPAFTLAQNTPPALDDRYEKWYQVEVIIFERTRSASVEQWPNNLYLGYPRRLHHLFTEEAWEAREALTSAALASPEDPEAPNNGPSPALSVSASPSLFEDAAVELPEMETPFLLLPSSAHELSNAAQRLRNRSAYTVLFHERWRQPLEASKDAGAVVVHAGERFGEHNTLEGSLKISVDRYLHIDANLWLSRFEANYGQSTEAYWPSLPPQPQAPEPEPPVSEDMRLTQDGVMTPTPEEQSDLDGLSTDFSIGGALSQQLDTFSFDDDGSLGFESDYQRIDQAPFIVNEIIQLKQKRRMRSEELHYIDHPRLGILVKVTPYEVTLPEGY